MLRIKRFGAERDQTLVVPRDKVLGAVRRWRKCASIFACFYLLFFFRCLFFTGCSYFIGTWYRGGVYVVLGRVGLWYRVLGMWYWVDDLIPVEIIRGP